MNDKKKHIALVDDHSLFRSGIARLLEEFPDIAVDFEAANGKELQKVLPAWQHTTEVILMDITMPGLDGYLTTRWVKDTYPIIQVIALSMYEDETAIIKMLKAGAAAYVFKESKPTELYSAITGVMVDGYYSSGPLGRKLIRSFHEIEKNDPAGQLTAKESEFLACCASEDTYKEIAAKMKVAARTVDNYRESLFEKLNVKSRIGLVLFAIKRGIIKIESK